MDPKTFARIQELFTQARELEPDQVSAFLDQACGDETVLRSEVEQLLEHDQSPGLNDKPLELGQSIAQAVSELHTLDPQGIPDGFEVPGYRITGTPRHGGQAVVLPATQTSTGQQVALKILHKGRWHSPNDRARFDRETAALVQLDHPNIVRVIDRGQTPDGALYLVMNFIDGLTLDLWLAEFRRQNPPSGLPDDPAALLKMFQKIAAAVGVAHEAGIVHRDLKPGNILIDHLGEPHILDFGIARQQDAPTDFTVTVTGQFMGSLPWISPEQAEGKSSLINARSDVYSLGVILYDMLTGQMPYEVAGNMRDSLDNILRAQPTPPSAVIQAKLAIATEKQKRWRKKHPGPISRDLEAIVFKALAKSPQARYPDAGHLADDIGRYLAGQSVLAEPTHVRIHDTWLGSLTWPGKLIPLAAMTAIIGGVLWMLLPYLSSRPSHSNTPASAPHGDQSASDIRPSPSDTDELKDFPPSIAPSALLDTLRTRWRIPTSPIASMPDSEDDPKWQYSEGQGRYARGAISNNDRNQVVTVGFEDTAATAGFGLKALLTSHDGAVIGRGISLNTHRMAGGPHYWFSYDTALNAGRLGPDQLNEEGAWANLNRATVPRTRPRDADEAVEQTLIVYGRTATFFLDDRPVMHMRGIEPGQWLGSVCFWLAPGEAQAIRYAPIHDEDDLPKLAIHPLEQQPLEHFEALGAWIGCAAPSDEADPSGHQLHVQRIDARYSKPDDAPDLPVAGYTTHSVTDDDISQLAACTEILRLDLEGAFRVTGQSVEVIQGLKSLRTLNLRGTSISPTGISQIQNALPECTVQSDTAESIDLDRGLVAHWTFESGIGEELVDASGNQHHGRLLNMTPGDAWSDDTPPTPGANRFALRFDGEDDVVEVPDSDGLELYGDNQAMTVSAWVKTDSTTFDFPGIVDKDGESNGYTLFFGQTGDIMLGFSMGSVEVEYGDFIFSGSAQANGQWHHVACVVQEGFAILYVDGRPAMRKQFSEQIAPQPSDLPLLLGARHPTHNQFGDPITVSETTGLASHYKGLMDEVRLYNRALTPTEIVALASQVE